MACENAVPLTGGAQYHIYYLSKYLTKKGHKICIVTHRPSTSISKSIYEVPNVEYRFRNISERGLWSLIQFPINLFFALIETRKYDLIHLHYSSKFAAVYALAARVNKIPSVVTLHGRGTLESSVNRSVTARVWRKISLKSMDIGIAPSEEIRNLAILLSKKPIFMIPNGVETKSLKYKNRKIESNLVFCSLRRLVQKNGVIRAALIIKELATLEPEKNFVFLICGDGPEKEAISLISRNNPSNFRIEFLGQTKHENLSVELDSAIFSLFFSSAEAISLALLETLALGIIPIASNVGGLAEVIDSGINGFLIGKPTPSDYIGNSIFNEAEIKTSALQLRKIVTLPNDKLKIISKNARETAEKYDWNQIAETSEKLFLKIRNGGNY